MGDMRARSGPWIAAAVVMIAAVALGLTLCAGARPDAAVPAGGASIAEVTGAVDEPVRVRAHASRVDDHAEGVGEGEVEDALDRAGTPIVLERALPIAGHVVDADGAPIEGALVQCDEDRHAIVLTGPDGAFGWDDFPADGMSFGLSAVAPGHVRTHTVVSPGHTDVRIVLQRPATLEVRLVDEQGAALGGVGA